MRKPLIGSTKFTKRICLGRKWRFRRRINSELIYRDRCKPRSLKENEKDFTSMISHLSQVDRFWLRSEESQGNVMKRSKSTCPK